MWPTLISAGASLLGGILGRNSENAAIAKQNAYNAPDQVRARAEKAGFNPLLFVGPGVGQQTATGGSNYMGQAIADAGLMMADKLSERQASQKLAKAMDANRRLQNQLTQATIRPKVDGIYARSEMLPSVSSALGGGHAGSSRSSSAGSMAGGSSSAMAGGPNPYDQNGKLAGIWMDGAFVQRPVGFSSGNDIENELGDTIAAEAAVGPLAAAYSAKAVPIMARHAALIEYNGRGAGHRGLPKNWRAQVARIGNRGRAPNDIILGAPGAGYGRLAGPVRSY